MLWASRVQGLHIKSPNRKKTGFSHSRVLILGQTKRHYYYYKLWSLSSWRHTLEHATYRRSTSITAMVMYDESQMRHLPGSFHVEISPNGNFLWRNREQIQIPTLLQPSIWLCSLVGRGILLLVNHSDTSQSCVSARRARTTLRRDAVGEQDVVVLASCTAEKAPGNQHQNDGGGSPDCEHE